MEERQSFVKSVRLDKKMTIKLNNTFDPANEKHKIFFPSEKEVNSDPFSFRLHNVAERVHSGTIGEILELIEKCEPQIEKYKGKLEAFLENDNEFNGTEESDIEFINQCNWKIESYILLFLVFKINLKIRKAKEDDPSISSEDFKPIEDIIQAEIDKTEGFDSTECIMERSIELQDVFPHFLTEEIEKFVHGKKYICIPAVKITLKVLERVLMQLKINMNLVKMNNNKNYPFKNVLIYTMKCCRLFDFLFSAALDDENDILYKNKLNEEADLLLDCLEFSTPKDVKLHRKNLLTGLNNMNYFIAVANQGFKDEGFFARCTKALSWAFYYKDKEELYKVDSQATLTMLHKDRWAKVMDIVRNHYIKKRINAKDTSFSIGLNTLIYIPNYPEDQLTTANIEDISPPNMMTHSLDLPFSVGLDVDYDHDRHIQVRVVANDDWNRVNWYYGNVIDPSLDPVYYEAIIIHLHGGGFILGSSGEAQPTIIRFCKDTGYPIFSVDYRLAPEYKYPSAISDCFLVYCWFRTYAEKYLRIKFGKILLYGESAGGNCLLGVTSLCIQKGIEPPDGITSVYAAIGCGMNIFSPSLLFSLDDPILNASFLSICCQEYVDDETHLKQHYTLSPKFIPKEILKKFPPIRMIICGLDPLRDEQIRFVYKCASFDLNIHATEYRYLTHMCLGHNQEPYKLKEASKFLEQISYYISELGKMH
ncbi:unnamed protein product [Moneuplotes crassus]|uniref:Alpha/beta hydrolase fold-3 domain-containing protein n=1 Tax=Euplotes crassus TaxID=5936 RepID=A0AAD2D7A1_EUPCR|nr:unnamed protein product [Moneuplotes crassus]